MSRVRGKEHASTAAVVQRVSKTYNSERCTADSKTNRHQCKSFLPFRCTSTIEMKRQPDLRTEKTYYPRNKQHDAPPNEQGLTESRRQNHSRGRARVHSRHGKCEVTPSVFGGNPVPEHRVRGGQEHPLCQPNHDPAGHHPSHDMLHAADRQSCKRRKRYPQQKRQSQHGLAAVLFRQETTQYLMPKDRFMTTCSVVFFVAGGRERGNGRTEN